MKQELKSKAFEWLQALIEIPSFSREESQTADYLEAQIRAFQLQPFRKGNNLWLRNSRWKEQCPTILLCSHHDTVRPVKGWTKDPFTATLEGQKLTGLGSNDAGASLVALLATFLFL